MNKYDVMYSGGESRMNPRKSCDFMLAVLDDGTELYAERVYPDGVEHGSEAYSTLEAQYYEELKAEIIEQAKAHGVTLTN